VNAALLGVLLACGAPGGNAVVPADFTVTVRVRVEHSIAARVPMRDLQDETESLWRPYGVQLEWLAASAPLDEAAGFAIDVRLERFDLSPWAAILGNAMMGVNHTHGPIRVSYEAAARVLAAGSLARTSTTRIVTDREMARALGRVLAHEIGHVLLAAPYHDATGLMRANFSASDLAALNRSPFQLSCNGVARLRARVDMLTRDAAMF
jgi:hypothetical protein